ncbi:MAG: hypothetical protein IPQ05_03940 [Leptospiraceae bacterium]|nr:hypothetical protein [Leptospiraceae bacterium]
MHFSEINTIIEKENQITNFDKQTHKKKCETLFQKCIDCTRDKLCVADEKILSFYEGDLSLSVAYSAYENASASFLSKKMMGNEKLITCLKYFIQITEPIKAAHRLEKFKEDVLFAILRENYQSYLNKKNSIEVKSFFDFKINEFWKHISEEKRLFMIRFLIAKDEFKLASLFLLILSPNYSEQLTNNILLSKEIEKRLYIALEDDIFILAQINPVLYFRLLDLLSDDTTGILEVLQEFEAIAELKLSSLKKFSETLEDYNKVKSSVFPLQWFYSQLKNLDIGHRNDVLEYLQKEQVISIQDKQVLDMLFNKDSKFFLHSPSKNAR